MLETTAVSQCLKCYFQDRVFKERIEKDWEPTHKFNLAQVLKKVQEFEAKNGGATGCKELTGLDKLAKEELDAQVIDVTSFFSTLYSVTSD